MKNKKSKIDTCGGCTTAGGDGQYFRLAGPNCKIGIVRTTARAIFKNDYSMVKLGDG